MKTGGSRLLLLCLCFTVVHSFSTSLGIPNKRASSHSYHFASKWDKLLDDDDDLQFDDGPPVPRDMKYNLYNIQRQRENFESIKAVAGKDLCNDVYARDPDTSTFWFVGKVARVSGKM